MIRSDTAVARRLGQQLRNDDASPVEAVEVIEAAFPAKNSIAFQIAMREAFKCQQEIYHV